jgi:hypothetical protein
MSWAAGWTGPAATQIDGSVCSADQSGAPGHYFGAVALNTRERDRLRWSGGSGRVQALVVAVGHETRRLRRGDWRLRFGARGCGRFLLPTPGPRATVAVRLSRLAVFTAPGDGAADRLAFGLAPCQARLDPFGTTLRLLLGYPAGEGDQDVLDLW